MGFKQLVFNPGSFVLKPRKYGFHGADLEVRVVEEFGVHADSIVLPEEGAAAFSGAGEVAEDGERELFERGAGFDHAFEAGDYSCLGSLFLAGFV